MERTKTAYGSEGNPKRDGADELFNSDSLVAFGGAVKALDGGKLGGYLVTFTNPGDYDLTAERFDSTTDFGEPSRLPVLYHHGLDATLKRRRIGTADVKRDDVGLWVEAQLNLRDEYEKRVYEMARAGKMSWSSGSAAHSIERVPEAKGAHIAQWFIAEASLTPTPAEPRASVVAIKSLMALPSDAEATANRAAQTQGDDNGNASQQGDNQMDEKEIKALVDTATKPLADANAAQAEEIKSLKTALDAEKKEREKVTEALKAEPPMRGSGVQVNPNQKYPYKAFVKDAHGKIADAAGYGEFLQDIMAAESGTRSVSPRLANWQDMNTKAMKAASGLNAATPSQGGFFVQTDHNAELVREMMESGKVLSQVRRLPLSAGADSVTMNGIDETSRASTLWGGILAYWVQEATAATATKPKFREIKLEAKGLAALYYATDKLLKLAPALGAEVAMGFREAMTFKVEDAIINGTGAGRPLGIYNAGSLVSVSKETGQLATTILHDNLVKMKSRLFPSSWGKAVWLAHPDCSPQIDALAFGIGVAGVLSPYVTYGADGVTRVMGRPVVYTEHCQTLGTTGDIYLWDGLSYYFIDLGAIEEASSIHVAFTTYDTCFRFIYYCDGQPKLASALTPAHGSTTLTNQVKLDTRS